MPYTVAIRSRKKDSSDTIINKPFANVDNVKGSCGIKILPIAWIINVIKYNIAYVVVTDKHLSLIVYFCST